MKNQIHQIITDFDDQDAYKFFMQYAAFKHYPNAIVEYNFINRGEHKYPDGFGEELQRQINFMTNVRFTPEIEKYFRLRFKGKDGTPYFDEAYYGFLRGFVYKPERVIINQYGSDLEVKARGPWIESKLWECQVMSIICELYYIMTGLNKKAHSREDRRKHNKIKFEGFASLEAKVADFSMRRRFSKANQEEMLQDFLEFAPQCLIGTSNVMFSRKFDIKAIGTQAHEWYMFHAAMFGVLSANPVGLEKWVATYQGALGISLTDTYGSKNFWENFNLLYSKLFDGVRHDSDDPIKYKSDAVKHYESLGINSLHKTIVFSDGINSYNIMKDIKEACIGVIMHTYGIGTWLGNDVGVPAMNIVIKMIFAKMNINTPWKPCVKISDNPAKSMGGTQEAIDLYKKELGYE